MGLLRRPAPLLCRSVSRGNTLDSLFRQAKLDGSTTERRPDQWHLLGCLVSHRDREVPALSKVGVDPLTWTLSVLRRKSPPGSSSQPGNANPSCSGAITAAPAGVVAFHARGAPARRSNAIAHASARAASGSARGASKVKRSQIARPSPGAFALTKKLSTWPRRSSGCHRTALLSVVPASRIGITTEDTTLDRRAYC